METHFSLLFYLKKSKNYIDGPVPIYMRITVNGNQKEITTAKQCKPEQWHARANRLKGNSEIARKINSHLDWLKVKMDDIYDKLTRQGSSITPEAMRNEFIGVKEELHNLLDAFEDHNKRIEALIGKDFTKGTLTKYKTTKKHLQGFLRLKHKLSDIEVKKVEYSFITDFDFYLRTNCGCANNSAIKHLKNLGKIIRECLAKKWIAFDPFAGHKNKLKRIDRVILSMDELQKITDKEIANERLNQVRDIFLFCCYTGLPYKCAYIILFII